MTPELPPPDPNEASLQPPMLGPVPAPIAVFSRGIPSPRENRISDTVLDWRPGVLFVFGGR